MRTTKILCLLLALGVAVRAEAGTVLIFDGNGNITGSYVDQTTPYSYGKIQTQTSGLIYKKAGQMGIAPTDVRVTKTIQAVETVATGAASGARAGFGGGWIGMVIGAVIGAVANFAIGLGLDKLVSWLFGSGNSVTSTQPIGGHWQYYETYLYPQPVTASSQQQVADFQSLADAAMSYGANYNQFEDAQKAAFGPSDPTYTYFHYTFLGSCNDSNSMVSCQYSVQDMSGQQATATANVVAFTGMNGTPASLQPGGQYTGSGSTSTGTISQAAANVPAAEKAQPINPQLVASGTNGLWQQASQQPGYQGIPYDPTNPITTQDATDWASANPGYTPSVDDGLGTGTGAGTQGNPGSGGSVGSMPISNQPGSTDTTPGVNTGTGTTPTTCSAGMVWNGTMCVPSTTTPTCSAGQVWNGTACVPSTGTGTGTGSGSTCGGPGQPACEVDWGTNPNTAQPSLENTPTIAMILGPIMNMLPGFKGFQMPAHTGVCPTGTFSMFGHTYTMDQHCTLFEQNRSAISAAFALVFLLASVFIVLTA